MTREGSCSEWYKRDEEGWSVLSVDLPREMLACLSIENDLFMSKSLATGNRQKVLLFKYGMRNLGVLQWPMSIGKGHPAVALGIVILPLRRA